MAVVRLGNAVNHPFLKISFLAYLVAGQPFQLALQALGPGGVLAQNAGGFDGIGEKLRNCRPLGRRLRGAFCVAVVKVWRGCFYIGK